MRIPGSPEEVSTEIGRATPHFITDFYASAHFKLTPEKFINRCDKCFISLPGCNKMSLEGKLTLHFHTMPFTLSLALQLSTLMLLHYHCTNALDTCTSALYNCSLCMLCTQFYRCTKCFLSMLCTKSYRCKNVFYACSERMLCVYIPYSGKLWRALNLANQSPERFGKF